jgi:cbb3-type cytochrome oxidase subunit 3
MMNVFVKARAWQVMAVLLSPMLMMVLLERFDIFGSTSERLLVPVLLLNVLFILWVWSIGDLATGLSRSSKGVIDKCFTIIAISLIPITILFLWIEVKVVDDTSSTIAMINYYLGLYGKVAWFFFVGYASKKLVEAEKNTRVKFFDFIGTFILMLIFFIGVWFIQPRVNKLWKKQQLDQAGR